MTFHNVKLEIIGYECLEIGGKFSLLALWWATCEALLLNKTLSETYALRRCESHRKLGAGKNLSDSVSWETAGRKEGCGYPEGRCPKLSGV